MSQRLHNCMNNVHTDPLHGGDQFANMLRGGKMEISRGSLLNRRPPSAGINPTVLVPPMQQQQNVALRNRRNAPTRQVNTANFKNDRIATNVVHKELDSDNNALVEVTVKTHNAKHRSRSNSRTSNREPWGKLLKQQLSHENVSSFNFFDPLRTLHFLAKELQNKLLESLPNDINVMQMVQDMQHALQRIPPEIASSVQLLSGETCQIKASNSDLKKKKLKTHSKDNLLSDPEKLTCMLEKGCQTMRTNYAEAEKLQKHLEESSAKIETACKQMEIVCNRLKSEKEELDIMLRAERETVKFLRKQMEESENEKAESKNAMVQMLQMEKESLQAQVNKLMKQIESQQELRTQKSVLDEQVQLLSHQVTLLNMEKEKYVAILSARDRQIKEIRCEMNQLQEVINEQLVELQNGQCSSLASTITNMTSDQLSWLLTKPKDDVSKHNTSEKATAKGNQSSLCQLYMKNKLSSNQEMQGDSSATSTETRKTPFQKDHAYKRKSSPRKVENVATEQLKSPHIVSAYTPYSDTHANIRNMFAEIKKQAMLVTAPMVETQKLIDLDGCNSEQSILK